MGRLILIVVLALAGFYGVWPAYTGYRIYQGLEANEPARLASAINFESVRQSMKSSTLEQINQRIETVLKENLGPASPMIAKAIPQDNIEKIVDGALASVVTPEQLAEIYSKGGDFNGALKTAVLEQIDKMGGLAAVLNLGKALGENAAGGTSGENTGDNQTSGGTIGGIQLPGGFSGLLKNKEVSEAIGGLAGKMALDPSKLANKMFPALARNGKGSPSGDGKATFGFSNVKELGFAGPLALRLGVARRGEAQHSDVVTEMAFENYDWRITKLTPNLIER